MRNRQRKKFISGDDKDIGKRKRSIERRLEPKQAKKMLYFTKPLKRDPEAIKKELGILDYSPRPNPDPGPDPGVGDERGARHPRLLGLSALSRVHFPRDR